ncbi:MAG: spherulation-specific family 4 protein, partial [Thermoproteota archaeon]
VATGNGNRNLDDVLKEIKTGLDADADGVFLDEVAMLHSDRQVDHYKEIYDYVKSSGSDRIVIANPGSILVNEKVMTVSDIVSFEHQWRLASQIDWFSAYPATRFMGISSNDIENVMGYKVDGEAALRDTIDAWQGGIGYHYSTNTYTALAPWFEDYQKALEDYESSGTALRELWVKTVDSEGSEIKGLWIEVKKDDRVVITGFSPTRFLLPDGDYSVGAGSYQSFAFSRWQDGETSPYHKVSLAGDAELVAIYKSEHANLRIESYDNLGNAIKGMHVMVRGSDDGKVDEGFTPLSLRLPLGQYSIEASSNEYYDFKNWDDGSQTRQVGLQEDARISAYYDNLVAAKLGTDIFANCQGYQQEVANAMFQHGPLGGLLELQMRRSLMASAGCPVV